MTSNAIIIMASWLILYLLADYNDKRLQRKREAAKLPRVPKGWKAPDL